MNMNIYRTFIFSIVIQPDVTCHACLLMQGVLGIR